MRRNLLTTVAVAAGLVLPMAAGAQTTPAQTAPAPMAPAPMTTAPMKMAPMTMAPGTTPMTMAPGTTTPMTMAPMKMAPGATAPMAGTSAMPANPVVQPAAARGAMMSPDRVEQRITEMHKKLKITTAQEPQWASFAAVMRGNATDMQAVMAVRTSGFNKMSAVDNMQSYQAMAQQHAAALQKLVPAFATLYAALSAEQKTAADEMFRTAGMGHGGRAG